MVDDLRTRLNTSVDRLEVDSGLLRDIVQGDDEAVVSTEGGIVDSAAKAIKEARDRIIKQSERTNVEVSQRTIYHDPRRILGQASGTLFTEIDAIKSGSGAAYELYTERQSGSFVGADDFISPTTEDRVLSGETHEMLVIPFAGDYREHTYLVIEFNDSTSEISKNELIPLSTLVNTAYDGVDPNAAFGRLVGETFDWVVEDAREQEDEFKREVRFRLQYDADANISYLKIHQEPIAQESSSPIYLFIAYLLKEEVLSIKGEKGDVGASTFEELTDTPLSLDANQLVAVNASGTALEFVPKGVTGATDFTGLSDTPATYPSGTTLRLVSTNSAGDGLDFVPAVFGTLRDTPSSFAGQGGKVLAVNAGENALEYINAATGGSGLTGLQRGDALAANEGIFDNSWENFFTYRADVSDTGNPNSISVDTTGLDIQWGSLSLDTIKGLIENRRIVLALSNGRVIGVDVKAYEDTFTFPGAIAVHRFVASPSFEPADAAEGSVGFATNVYRVVTGLGGAAGSGDFVGLTDTPSEFTGSASQLVAVNADGNALVFIPDRQSELELDILAIRENLEPDLWTKPFGFRVVGASATPLEGTGIEYVKANNQYWLRVYPAEDADEIEAFLVGKTIRLYDRSTHARLIEFRVVSVSNKLTFPTHATWSIVLADFDPDDVEDDISYNVYVGIVAPIATVHTDSTLRHSGSGVPDRFLFEDARSAARSAPLVIRRSSSSQLQLGTTESKPTGSDASLTNVSSVDLAIPIVDWENFDWIELHTPYPSRRIHVSAIDSAPVDVWAAVNSSKAQFLRVQLFKNQNQIGTPSSSTHRLEISAATTNDNTDILLSRVVGYYREVVDSTSEVDGFQAHGDVTAAARFRTLLDTPADYAGQRNKLVSVRSDETGLEFVDAAQGGGSGVSTFSALLDTPSSLSGAGDKFVAVNSAGNALVFVDAPEGGGGGATVAPPALILDVANFQATNFLADTGLVIPDGVQWLIAKITDSEENAAPHWINVDELPVQAVSVSVYTNPEGEGVIFGAQGSSLLRGFFAKSATNQLLFGASTAVGFRMSLKVWSAFTGTSSGGGTGGGGGGSSTFSGLTDTPASLAGQGGKVVAVNSAGNALEFVSASSGGAVTFEGLTNTPSSLSGQGGKFVAVNSAGNAIVFVDAPAGGGSGGGGGSAAPTSLYSGVEFITSSLTTIGTAIPSGVDWVILKISEGEDNMPPLLLHLPSMAVKTTGTSITNNPEGEGWVFTSSSTGGIKIYVAITSGRVLLAGLNSTQTWNVHVQIWSAFTGSGGGSGSSTFAGLTDTPSALTGQGGRFVAVNSSGTALEFVTAPTGGGGGTSTPATTSARGIVELATSAEARAGTDVERAVTPVGLGSAIRATNISDLANVPAISGQGGRFAAVNSAGNAIEFVAAPTGAKGDKGDTGDRGPAGADGVAGPTGATGATGPPGADGDDGVDGDRGPAGATGPTGAAGTPGVKGDKGDPGAAGAMGATGAAGADGAKGDKGDKGDTGTQGPRGLAGAEGAPGATGPRGADGTDGEDGDTGATGATGPTGPQGIQGVPGVAGPKGDKGDTGDTGPQGPKGDPGEGGSGGGTIRPESHNDIYIDSTATGDQPTANANWLEGDLATELDIGAAQPTPTSTATGYKRFNIAVAYADYDAMDKIEVYATHATAVMFAQNFSVLKSEVDGGDVVLVTSNGHGSTRRAVTVQLFKNQNQLGSTSSTTHRLTFEAPSWATNAVSVGRIRLVTNQRGGATGPTGPAGDAGAKGDKGDTGAAGQRGATGAQGPTGSPGAAGADGQRGPAGATGPAGAKGDKGDVGDRGPEGAAGADGSTTFAALTDTPSALASQGGKFVAVNSAGNALEFVTAPSGGGSGSSTFVGLTDTPASLAADAGKTVVVNAAGDALEFVDAAVSRVVPNAEHVAARVAANIEGLVIDDDTNFFELDYTVPSGTKWVAVALENINAIADGYYSFYQSGFQAGWRYRTPTATATLRDTTPITLNMDELPVASVGDASTNSVQVVYPEFAWQWQYGGGGTNLSTDKGLVYRFAKTSDNKILISVNSTYVSDVIPEGVLTSNNEFLAQQQVTLDAHIYQLFLDTDGTQTAVSTTADATGTATASEAGELDTGIDIPADWHWVFMEIGVGSNFSTHAVLLNVDELVAGTAYNYLRIYDSSDTLQLMGVEKDSSNNLLLNVPFAEIYSVKIWRAFATATDDKVGVSDFPIYRRGSSSSSSGALPDINGDWVIVESQSEPGRFLILHRSGLTSAGTVYSSGAGGYRYRYDADDGIHYVENASEAWEAFITTEISFAQETEFIALGDTPSEYTDSAGKILAVNPAESAVEFIDAPAGTGRIVGRARLNHDYKALDVIEFQGSLFQFTADGRLPSTWSDATYLSLIRSASNPTSIVEAITLNQFTALTDTPLTLSGQGGRFVAVNSAGNALEFVAAPTGPKGDKGDAGARGPAGTAGAAGATGPTGATGPAGRDGNDGARGPTGAAGATGATGPQGTPGATSFQLLTDTPSDFTGQTGKILAVNGAADALEYADRTDVSLDLLVNSSGTVTSWINTTHHNYSVHLNIPAGLSAVLLRVNSYGPLWIDLNSLPSASYSSSEGVYTSTEGGLDIGGNVRIAKVGNLLLIGYNQRTGSTSYIAQIWGFAGDLVRGPQGVPGPAGEGGGSTTFAALTDTPAALTGQGGRHVAVNSGGTALEFVAAPTAPGNASATARGIVELATAAEARTGTDTVRAVTPAGLKSAIDAIPSSGGASLTTDSRVRHWVGYESPDRESNQSIRRCQCAYPCAVGR